jgi:hypothetical protein
MIEQLIPWVAFVASTAVGIWQHIRLRRMRFRLELALEDRAHWHGEAMRCEARARGVGGKGGVVPVIDAGAMPRAQAGAVG